MIQKNAHPARRRARWPLALLGAVLVSGLAVTAEAAPGGDDPLVEPVPRPEYVDDARSFVVDVDFRSAESGSSAGVVVVNVATPGAEHLKQDLVVTSNDIDGLLLRSTTMPNPALSFADGFGYFAEPGRHPILVPYDSRAEQITLATPGGASVATIDTTQAIREYCIANPDDPDCVEADLTVTAVEAAAPLFAVTGEPVSITVASTLADLGPDTPVEAQVERTVVAGAGITVDPAAPDSTRTTLAVGTPQRLEKAYTVTCTLPGARTLDFTTAVAPRRATVVDPVAANDAVTTRLTVDCAQPVTINVQPGSATNPVNREGSTLPVAVLTTDAGEYGNPLAFQATTIVADSVRFASPAALLGGAGTGEVHGAIHPENALELDERTRDGDVDVLLHFRPRSDALAATDTRACVLGRFTSPTGPITFIGCDTVRVIR